MKKLIRCLVFLLLASVAWGQSLTSTVNTITASGSACSSWNNTAGACDIAQLPAGGAVSAAIVLTGTWSGTVQFENSADNQNTWVAVLCSPQPSGTAVSSATANGTWVCPVSTMTFLRVRASAWTSGIALATITPGGPGSGTIGTKGQPCVASSTGTGLACSSAWIDVTPFLPTTIVASTDLCAGVNGATTASVQGNAVHAEGLPRKTYCNTDWITIGGTFLGDLYLGATLFFTNGINQPIPSGVTIYAMGRTGGPNYTSSGGTAIVACSSTVNVAADFSNICLSVGYTAVKATGNGGGDTSNYAALLCLSNFACEDGNSHGAGGTGFGTQIWNFEVNCSYVANCVGMENDYMQELSGFWHVEVKNWGNTNGIGLSCGGGIGGCQNSTIEDVQLANGSTAGCVQSSTAVGLRIWGGTGTNPAPRLVTEISVVNNCATGTNPNDDIQIVNATNGAMHLDDLHCESFSRACVMLGVATVMGSGTATDTGGAANNVLIASAGTGPGGVGSNIRIASAANFAGAAVTNLHLLSVWQTGSAPVNLIGDDNNLPVLAATTKTEVEYTTDGSGKCLYDSSGTNPSSFPGFVQSDGGGATNVTRNDAWRTSNYSNVTTSDTAFASYVFPAVPGGRHYSVHCGGSWHEAGTTDAIAISVLFSTAPTNAMFAAQAYWNTSTTTAVVAGGGKSGITTNTVQALVTTGLANASGAEYPLTIDGGVEVPAAGTTMQFLAHATVGTTAVVISRDFYCAIQP